MEAHLSQLLQGLIAFLNASPTPYHAVENSKNLLLAAGFSQLNESKVFDLKPGGSYFVERRNASLIAFKYGQGSLAQSGINIIGAHTDSPTLKVKPKPELHRHSYLQLGVEVYGGVLLNPWFDRDLSIAGRITLDRDGALEHHLINFERAVATIPSLAIHLDRSANKDRTVNPQEHMRPILLQGDKVSFNGVLVQELKRCGIATKAEHILAHDLSFYDTQAAGTLGLNHEFLASARLDNLLSSYVGLQALLSSDDENPCMLALHDHEEVGSQSDIGANGNMLLALLERMCPGIEDRHRMLSRSTLLSVDNAHGIHPNYADKHDQGHGPKLNHGPVIKVDANQSYATSSETAGMLGLLAKAQSIPLQHFVTRADMRCGSTIGPMTAAKAGIKTADLGVPTFAMHSIREQAGVQDIVYLSAILSAFLNSRT